MIDLVRSRWPGAVLLVALTLSSSARAQPAEQTAASAFDEGVELFEHARYQEAAKAFLKADAAVPNAEALSNALSAARRANDHLLVATVAKRAVAREATEPDLAARARQALAEASKKLAAIDLACEPTPCTLTLDGATTKAGEAFVLPGNHQLVARGDADAQAEESMTLEAGARYRILLHPVKPGETSKAADVAQTRQPAESAPPTRPEAKSEPRRDRVEPRPLSPGWFYAGAGATALLAGITTWSGLDALSGKRELPSTPTTGQVDDVRGKVRRTDILLASTVIVGAATAYAGLELVQWGDASVSAAVAPGELRLGARGRF
ncbi:MAG: hypothetical protein KC776_32705 [Myxococcales bacterium]|nr:hypothetical protein [Myxococcales bacterium]